MRILIVNHTCSSEESSDSESEEEEEEETAEVAPADGLQTPSGLETPSGMHSVVSTVPGGLETPDFLELRKGRAQSEMSEGPTNRTLYQVVPEKQTSVRGLMGSERGYDVAGLSNPANVPVLGDDRGHKVHFHFLAYSRIFANFLRSDLQRKANGVDVSIDSADLEGLTPEQLRAKYDAASKGSAGVPGGANREDFSDMVAQEMSKKKQKMDKDRGNKGKEKEYKF